MSGIELLFDDNSGVVAEFPNELIGSNIHCVNASGAALKEAVGKSTRGGTNVNADPAGGINLKCIECALEFKSSATHVALFFFHLKWGIGEKLGARFVDDAVSAAHLAGKDESFGLLARIAESAGDKQGVGAFFFHAESMV